MQKESLATTIERFEALFSKLEDANIMLNELAFEHASVEPELASKWEESMELISWCEGKLEDLYAQRDAERQRALELEQLNSDEYQQLIGDSY